MTVESQSCLHVVGCLNTTLCPSVVWELVSDTRLQAIADAYRRYKARGAGTDEWLELKSLLDAFAKEER